jgi:hypothetical protein
MLYALITDCSYLFYSFFPFLCRMYYHVFIVGILCFYNTQIYVVHYRLSYELMYLQQPA